MQINNTVQELLFYTRPPNTLQPVYYKRTFPLLVLQNIARDQTSRESGMNWNGLPSTRG